MICRRMAWSPNKPVPPPRDHTGVVTVEDAIPLTPIGVVHSPYKERHGTPRQSTALNESEPMVSGRIELDSAWIPDKALRDLDGFERIWLITHLHLNPRWGALVRPPRGGVRRGVFATRSPHHPNGLGLSVVLLDRVEGATLYVRGLDLIDGTPVLDIKPYVPYCDAFPESAAGWVDDVSEE